MRFFNVGARRHQTSGPEVDSSPLVFLTGNLVSPIASRTWSSALAQGQQPVRAAHARGGKGFGRKRMPHCNDEDRVRRLLTRTVMTWSERTPTSRKSSIARLTGELLSEEKANGTISTIVVLPRTFPFRIGPRFRGSNTRRGFKKMGRYASVSHRLALGTTTSSRQGDKLDQEALLPHKDRKSVV